MYTIYSNIFIFTQNAVIILYCNNRAILNMKILTWNILASEWIKKSYYPGVNADVIFDNNTRFSRIVVKREWNWNFVQY
jgi:mRNA deadenylase 3'-5' endonuclease subunit Ccr4